MDHVSVLLAETVAFVNAIPDGLYVDATLGGGGHTRKLLESSPQSKVIALDRDEKILELTREKLKALKARAVFVKANFRDLDKVLAGLQVLPRSVNGFIFDLGVSSFQLDDGARGFSFRTEAPLDMRMGGDAKYDAAALVNELPQEELERLIRAFGGENFAGRIARVIVEERKLKRVATTLELANIVSKAVPSFYRHGKLHPATRTFQALRIAVNDELGALKEGLVKAAAYLARGGRIAVISFHSLEDRIVKDYFKSDETLKVITKKPVVPDDAETAENRRSRSAKLRVAEKL